MSGFVSALIKQRKDAKKAEPDTNGIPGKHLVRLPPLREDEEKQIVSSLHVKNFNWQKNAV